MKIKHLIIGMLAIAAAVACKEDQPLEEPKLDVDKSAVSVAATAGEATFNVTSNQSWTTYVDQDWVSLEPASGSASDKAVTVKLTAEDNEATEARTATVTVKAGELTKTVKVTQAAAQGETPEPPGPEGATYLLVGDAVGGWNFDNPVVLTLTEGYYVAKEVEVLGEKDMHFTKNSSWEGNVKGLHGRIAPDEIGEVGENNISLTTGGKYDVYLAEELDKFYFMTPGKTPADAVEHVEIATVWGVCGAIEGNQWGASSDPVMEQEGEWYVAKNITFTEVNLKVRGNNTWADDTKWGTVTQNQTCELNKAIAVSTCTEYKAANEGAGDNPNIYIAAPAGAYDVYFSPEKKEVWVMTPGYKPGEAPVEPETAELTTFLSFTSNVSSGTNSVTVQLAPAGSVYMESVTSEFGTWDQMAGEGKYLKIDVYSTDGTLVPGVYTPCEVAGTITEGTFGIGWDPGDLWGIGMVFENWGTCWMTHNADGTETGVKITDGTITVAADGDVYTITVESSALTATYTGKLSKDTTGGEEPDPQPQASAWALVGDFNGWDAAGSTYFLTELDSEYFVYYGFEAAAGQQFKFVKDGKWASQGGAEVGGEIGTAEPNTIQPAGGKNIVIAEAGKYDIYLAADLATFYVMTEGKLPSEATEPAPVEVTYTVVGTLDGINWNNSAPEGLMTKEGDYYVAKNVPFVTAATLYNGADQFEFKIVETATWNGYGVAESGAAASPANTEIALVENGQNIPVTATEGNYDVYFDKENVKVWVMNPGLKPGETPAEPEPEVPAFEEGEYFVMDGNGKVVSPIAEGSSYGYWNVTDAVEDGGSYIGYAENVFTFTAVDGGFTIQDVYGRYHYMTTYNSFSVSKSTQSDNSHVWTVTLQDDGSYAIVNNYTGKTVQFSSYGNYAPYTDVTGDLPYLVKADKVAEKPSVPEDEAAVYATNVTCTTVSSAYTDGVANVNGVPDVFTLKLGTSKLNGKATITLPAGTSEVTYYAVGWKGTSAKLQFSVGGSVAGTQSIAANTGATGNAPYTITVSDTDHYTFALDTPLAADTEVTVETTGSACRAILFGIQAK